jgi:hypothetical protein
LIISHNYSFLIFISLTFPATYGSRIYYIARLPKVITIRQVWKNYTE